MPTIHGMLSMARRALMAQQAAMSVASNNIANVNTEGYARRRAEFQPTRAERTAFGIFGTGVDLASVRSLRDPFIDQQFRRGLSDFGQYNTGQRQLQLIENVLGELGETGISNALDRFWNAWHDLSADPTTAAGRSVVRETANSLVARFADVDKKLTDKTDQINNEISATVYRVNSVVEEIAQLNREFLQHGVATHQLDDRRSILLDELARLTGARYRQEDNGSVTLFIGNVPMVENGDHRAFDFVKDNTGAFQIVLANSNDQPVRLTGGEVGALIEIRDSEIPALRAQLDDVVKTLAREVNRIHRDGHGLQGSQGVNFFDPATSGIDNFALNAEILDNANNIAASADGQPGNNEIALAIAELEHTAVTSDGYSISEAYRSTAAWLGTRVAEMDMRAEGTRLSLNQMAAWRDSVSGVSLDEEMAELVRFQHAFNASAKVVRLIDNVMDTIINLKI